MNGEAIIIWSNGDRYEGDCQNNLRSGKGIFYGFDGSLYKGEWF